MRKIAIACLCLCWALGALAQGKTVTGKVTDAKDGSPLAGVSVTVPGGVGVKTEGDGSFSISVQANAKTLVFSFVGFETATLTIPANGVLNVSLTSSENKLDEVVVVGYGTAKKKEVTGSMASVKGSTLATKPVQTFDQALAGRAAGVQITIPNGVLNSPPVFRIRGTNSISLSSYPLIVVDGIPSYTGDYSQTASAGNALANINPNDIESIDIAKDAAATSIYGSRAANGVVFITTKKGRQGKAKVSYAGWVSVNKPFRNPEVLNANDYIAFKTSAVANNPTASAIQYLPSYDAQGKMIDTKWADQVYRDGISQSHNVNVSGGSDATTYYFSAGYTDQQGILRGNNFKRLNTLLNVDSRINKVVTIGGKLSFSNEKNIAANTSGSLNGSAFNTGGLGRLAIVLPSIIGPYNNDGTYNINGSAIGSSNIKGISSLSYYNPVPLLDLNNSSSENNHIQSNAYLQIKPVNGLTLKTSYGIDYLLVDNNIFWTPITGDGYSYNGYAWSGSDKYTTSLWTTTGQYDRTIANKHNLSLLVGNEQQRRTSQRYGIQRQNLSDAAYNVIQAGYTTNNPADLFLGENYLLSNFARLSYNYDNKYFIGGNYRRDEYSALGEKKGDFYGVSAAWDVSKENFWTKSGIQKTISSLKVRGSYGKVGNIAGIGDFSPYSTFGSGLYGGLATLAFSSVGNDKLKWETSLKTDVGLQIGFLNDKITAEVTYYNNDINGLILNVPQSPSTGLPSSPPANVGSMYNKGIEFTVNAAVINKRDFSWNTSFNITQNKNEVTALAPGLPYILQSTSGLESVNRTEVGKSLGYLWVVKTNGVDPETGKRVFVNSKGTNVYYQYYAPTGQFNYSTTPDGTTKYVSPTGATAISQAADAVMYANTVPKIYGGWDNNFRYKNFDLNLMFTYQTGFYVYYGTNAGLHDQRWWNNSTDVLTKAWKSKGDANMLYAKPVYSDNVSNGSSMPLNINVFKGDFFKFKNASLGYTLPSSLLTKMKLASFRIYITGQNFLIATKYPGPDPEVSSNGNTTIAQGVDRNTAANAKTFLIGLNVGF